MKWIYNPDQFQVEKDGAEPTHRLALGVILLSSTTLLFILIDLVFETTIVNHGILVLTLSLIAMNGVYLHSRLRPKKPRTAR